MTKIRKPLAAAAAAASLLFAVETKNWVQDQPTDFEKGNLKKLSLRNDGRLRLAPETIEIFDASQPYLWALAEDSKGNLYAASGGPGSDKAKIYQLDPKGKSRIMAELPGSAVHAMTLNAKDELFAATSPDGKVYRITSAGKYDVYYDPKEKYIWALAVSTSGHLFVATGDQGKIHRVTAANQGNVFFTLDESHARSMVIDRAGNVIVGTEPGGLVLRVSAAGEGFVLYQSTRREITALALSKNDELFVAGVGAKQGAPPIPPPAQVQINIPPPGTVVNQAQPTQRIAVAPPTFTPMNVSVSGGSEVYKLDRDGAPLKIWSHALDVVYAIAIDAAGVPWIGTGNKGGVYRLDTPYLSTLLASLQPTQVTAMVSGRNGIHVATGNVGKVFRLGPALEQEGSIESEVLDAGSFTNWGRLQHEGSGAVLFETRSGNLERPQKNWSAWAPLKEGRVSSPAARFLQWRAVLKGDGKQSPELKSVDVAYRSKNLPPRMEDVQAIPQNYKAPAGAAALSSTVPSTLNLPPLGRNRPRHGTAPLGIVIDQGAQPMMVSYSKGSIGGRWLAMDDNGDTLEYKIELKGAAETAWKPLKDKIRERFYSWDATAYPDGQYQVRVTATDQPDNPPGQGLTVTMESELFTIDNTPPVISNLTAEPASNNINLRFRVKDAASVLQAVEYSINGGEWQWAEPTTRLTDSKEHEYHLLAERPGFGEITVAVRASDTNDNQSVEKTVLKTTER